MEYFCLNLTLEDIKISLMSKSFVCRTFLRTTRRSGCLLTASCVRLRSRCPARRRHWAHPHWQVSLFTLRTLISMALAWIRTHPVFCSSPSLDVTPIANGSAAYGNPGNKDVLIPNGGPSTMALCGPETPLANGVANGHITPSQESPFTGYIIAMHRKMVRTEQYVHCVTAKAFMTKTNFSVT